jgi:hypothetical protein
LLLLLSHYASNLEWRQNIAAPWLLLQHQQLLLRRWLLLLECWEWLLRAWQHPAPCLCCWHRGDNVCWLLLANLQGLGHQLHRRLLLLVADLQAHLLHWHLQLQHLLLL